MKQRWAIQSILVTVLCCAVLVGCPGLSPTLWLSHTAISFGVTKTEENFLLRNTGGGTLNWTTTITFTNPPVPASTWLTIDTAAGSTTSETELLTMTVDRGTLPSGSYNAVVTITPDVGAPRDVLIAMVVAGNPAIDVSTTNLSIACPNNETSFTITNTGDFPLTWNSTLLEPTTESVLLDPLGGILAPGLSQTVTVFIDCNAFSPGVHGFSFDIESDGGATVPMTLNIGVGVSPEISVEPLLLDFGQEQNVLTFDVWNSGAAGSILDFSLTTDRSDLIFMDPIEGVSIGTPNPLFPDLKTITVTIDRSAIQEETDGGTITISAPGAEDAEVLVIVEAAPLTLEGAQNRSRPPFMMRFVFLMRDMLGNAVDTLDPAIFEELQTAFSVFEDGVPLDPNESSMFVSSAENLRYNVALMLDYTGSMFAAASAANPSSGNALQELYAGTGAKGVSVGIAGDFINGLPDSHRIALMEYHERQQTDRVIHGFSTEKQPIIDAMQAFSLPPADHGASEIVDALADACQRLANEDLGALPFGDTDVRAVVFITDGRDTSSVTTVDQIITDAIDNRCRLYPIGFGEDVNAQPLVKMALETGGHYYAAPDLQALRDLLSSDSSVGPGAPGRVVTELRRQIVLSYVTLFQDGSHNYLVTADFDNQEGSFERDAVVALGGDVRAGQMALTTTGIQADGTAEVFVRTEYAPRNSSQFRLRFFTRPNTPYTVEIDPTGLAAEGWVLVEEAEAPEKIADSRVFTLLTTEDNPLPFGAFGNLLRIRFSGLNPAVDVISLGFRVDNRILVNPPVTKFFQYADSIVVEAGSATAEQIPILLEDGFDPDSPDAWDRDLDGTDDFDDEFPDNEFAQ
jgi:hypothetical protein